MQKGVTSLAIFCGSAGENRKWGINRAGNARQKPGLLKLCGLGLISALIFLFGLSMASALDVNRCQSIYGQSNTIINITGDIIFNSTVCLNIQASSSNITIEGNGYSIISNNRITSFGIFLSNGGDNAKVKNLIIEGYDYPVYWSTYSNVSLENVTIQNTYGKIFPASSKGVYRNVTFRNVKFTGYTSTHTSYYHYDTAIRDSFFYSNHAITFRDSNGITITNSTRKPGSPLIQFINVPNLNISNNLDLDLIYLNNVTGLNFNDNIFRFVNRSILLNFKNNKNTNYKVNGNIIHNAGYNSTSTYLFNLYDLYNSEMSNNLFGNSTDPLWINQSLRSGPVSIWAANNFTFYNNSMYLSNSYGLSLQGNPQVQSSNVMIESNKVYFNIDTNTYGITCGNDEVICAQDVTYISNCTMRNNYVQSPFGSTGKHMMMLKCARDSNVYNNTVINGGYNFVIKDSSRVNVFENSMTNGVNGTLHVKGTSHSLFYRNTLANQSRGAPIFVYWDNVQRVAGLNNTFYDMDLRSSYSCPQIWVFGNASTSQAFINVSITNASCLRVDNGSDSGVNSVSYYWRYSYLSNKNATLTVYDSGGSLVGQIVNSTNGTFNLKEFDNIDGALTSAGNYTIFASYLNYIINQSHDVSLEHNIEDNFMFDDEPSSCGNNDCGYGETPENCPSDCLSVTSLAASPLSSISYGTPSNFSCSNSLGLTTILSVNGIDMSEEKGIGVVRAAGTYAINCSTGGSGEITASSDSQIYIINKNAANGSLLAEGSQWEISYGTPTTVSYEEVNTGDSDIVYSIYQDGILSPTPEIAGLAAGSYAYALSSSEGENYTSNPMIDQENLTVTKAVPELILNFKIIFRSAYNISISANEDNSGDSDCVYSLYRNEVLIGTGSGIEDSAILPPGLYNYKFNVTGCANYTSNEDGIRLGR